MHDIGLTEQRLGRSDNGLDMYERDYEVLVGHAHGVDLVVLTDAGETQDVVKLPPVEGQVISAETSADGRYVFVLCDTGGVGLLHVFKRNREGFESLGGPYHTGGGLPCSLAIDGRCESIVVANYGGDGVQAGSLISFAIDNCGALRTQAVWRDQPRSRPPSERHLVSHPHHVEFVEDSLRLVDLGNDRVTWFARGATLTGDVPLDLPRGWGPRSACTHPGGVVLCCEIEPVVAYLRDGRPGMVTSAHPVPESASAKKGFSEIVALSRRRTVVAARRSGELIVIEDTREGLLRTKQVVTLPAKWPVSLALVNSTLLAACRDSDTLVGYKVSGGRLLPSPIRIVTDAAPVVVRAVTQQDPATDTVV